MPEPQIFGLTAADSQRLQRALRVIEGARQSTAPAGSDADGVQCVTARLGTRGTDPTRYSWTQQRPGASGWESLDLSGTETDGPAVDAGGLADGSGPDLGGKIVVLVRCTLAAAGGANKLAWMIAGYSVAPPAPTLIYQVPQCTVSAPTGTNSGHAVWRWQYEKAW